MTGVVYKNDFRLTWDCWRICQIIKTCFEEALELLESRAVIHFDSLTAHTTHTFAEKVRRLIHVEFEFGF